MCCCLRVIAGACCPTLRVCGGEWECRAPVSSVFVSSVEVPLWNRGPVSCQPVRDAAPLKGMLSGSFLSIISPATLIKAAAAHPHVLQAASEKINHIPNQKSP